MTKCDIWSKAKDKNGYGLTKNGRKTVRAHRVSYEKAYGEIPEGMCVLHKCDNPSCINPEHLFLGTKADNTADMINKGRQRHLKGGDHGMSKLTEEDVISIRKAKGTLREIANTHGISFANVWKIRTYKMWKHI